MLTAPPDAVSIILHDWRFKNSDQDWRNNLEFLDGLQSITAIWQSVADNAYESSLEALQSALYGRKSAEYGQHEPTFQYKQEDNEHNEVHDMFEWIIADREEDLREEEDWAKGKDEEDIVDKVEQMKDCNAAKSTLERAYMNESVYGDGEPLSYEKQEEEKKDNMAKNAMQASRVRAEVLVWDPGPWSSGWGRWTAPTEGSLI